MNSPCEQRKHKHLRMELTVLACVLAVFVMRTVFTNLTAIKAGVLRQVVKVDPDNIDALRFLGDYYTETERYEEAIDCWKQVVQLSPHNRDAYERLADCYWELGQPEKSIETWKEAATADPNWTWPHLRLAFDYNDVGRYDEAIAEWHEVISREPDVNGVYVLLGNTCVSAGRHDDAMRAYQKAVSLNPEHKEAHFRLGKVYLQMGKKDLALLECEILKGLDGHLAEELQSASEKPALLKGAAIQPDQVSTSYTSARGGEEEELIRQLDSELAKLGSDAAVKREKIDAWYADAHTKLTRWAKERHRQLDSAEKAGYACYLQQLQNTRSITQRDFSAQGQGTSSGYVSPYGYVYGNNRIAVQGRSTETTSTSVVGNPAAEYQAFLGQVKQARQAIGQQFVKLDKQRQRYIDELKNDTHRKRQSIEHKKRRTQTNIARTLQGGPPLTIEAIGIAGDSRCYAVIEQTTVHEGCTINGYIVRRIDAERQTVELESEGRIFVLPLGY